MATIKMNDPVTGEQDPNLAATAPAPAKAAPEPTPDPVTAPAGGKIEARPDEDFDGHQPTLAEIEHFERKIAAWRAKHTPASPPAPAGQVTRKFKVNLLHNHPLVVEVTAPVDADWSGLAVAQFNKVRGITKTTHQHTVEDHVDGQPAPVAAP